MDPTQSGYAGNRNLEPQCTEALTDCTFLQEAMDQMRAFSVPLGVAVDWGTHGAVLAREGRPTEGVRGMDCYSPCL